MISKRWYQAVTVSGSATCLWVFCNPLTVFAVPSISSRPAPNRDSADLPSLERVMDVANYQNFAQQIADPATPDSSDAKKPRNKITPLQMQPIRLFNIETANQLPKGTINITGGVRRFANGSVGGTGLQTYYGLIEGGVTDRLQLGLHIQRFDDPLRRAVNGRNAYLLLLGPSFQAKYKVLDREKFKLGVSASIERLEFGTTNGLFLPANSPTVPNSRGNTVRTTPTEGTLQVPLTFTLTPKLQWHITPGIAFFPGTINNGSDFYGTFFHLGTGFSWQVVDRFSLFGDVTVPFGPGSNAVNSNGDLSRQVVWSGGGRLLVSPTVGLDLFATNALGNSPVTRLLPLIPGGGQTAVGLNFNYTPDLFRNYPTSFRPLTKPLTERDYQLWADGLTLTSASTLSQGSVLLRGGIGAGADFSLAYGLSDDAQVEFIGQKLSDDGVVPGYGNSLKLGAAGKFRFLDQSKGDPFSLSLKTAFAQGIRGDSVGVASADVALQYQVNPKIAVTFNPKFGTFGGARLFGTGLGVNADLYKGIQFIGEVTPRFTGVDKQPVWSVGLRYQHTPTGLGIDVYGSNAIGRNLIGGLVAEDRDTNVGVNIHWLGRRNK